MMTAMSDKKVILPIFFIVLCGIFFIFLLGRIESVSHEPCVSFHEKLTERYGSELIDLYCQKQGISHCDSEIKHQIEVLFPEKVMHRFKTHAEELVKRLGKGKAQTTCLIILKNIQKIQGVKERISLYFSLCKALRFTFDIPCFRDKKILHKQLTLLHQAIVSLSISAQRELEEYKAIGNPSGMASFLVSEYKKNWGVYKHRGHLTELAAWELSLALGCDTCFAPSSSVYSHGKWLIYQPFQKAKFLRGLFFMPSEVKKQTFRVSEWNFWQSNLLFFLVGHMDLTQANIGMTKNKTLFICDNEDVFSNRDHCYLCRSEQKFDLKLPIMNMMIDWPQAKEPLSRSCVKKVQKLVQNWKKVKAHLPLYLDHPFNDFQLSQEKLSALVSRFEKVLAMDWIQGKTTFQDFILTAYPRLYAGIDELAFITSKAIGCHVSPMSSLLFIAKCRNWSNSLSQEDSQSILHCLEKYHEIADDEALSKIR